MAGECLQQEGGTAVGGLWAELKEASFDLGNLGARGCSGYTPGVKKLLRNQRGDRQ